MGLLGHRLRTRLPRRFAPRASFDRRLYALLNGLPHSYRSDLYVSILSDLGEGAGWWAAALWLALLDGRRGRRVGLATVLATVAASRVAQDLLKPFFRRIRPWHGGHAVVVGRRTVDTSFPSGHTAASFAAATVLATAYPRALAPLYTTAGAVGLSRVHLGHHFPTDVAAGALLGTAVGWVSSRLWSGRSAAGPRRSPRTRAAERPRRASAGSTTGAPSPPAAAGR
jgi:membrane-associated phospholipid phosphatase